jgi:hypothetical protein
MLHFSVPCAYRAHTSKVVPPLKISLAPSLSRRGPCVRVFAYREESQPLKGLANHGSPATLSGGWAAVEPNKPLQPLELTLSPELGPTEIDVTVSTFQCRIR